MKKIVTICGPTGIGKTGFAIALARAFDGEIIGADSMQIYRHLDIGTAKPTKDELAQAPHHLVDFLDPDQPFDAGAYATKASKAVDAIHERAKLPIVAGGTGLYIRALLYGLFRAKPICEATLSALMADLEEKGSEHLHRRLELCDPEAAERIHPNDGFRVVRALEVFQTSGRPISQEQKAHDFRQNRYESLTLGLFMDRKVLYDRINYRVDLMIEQGLLKEVTDLVGKGYSMDLKSMQSIGYRHMAMFIRQEVSFDEAVRLLKRDTRRYAKRQFTWFKKEPGIIWVAPSEIEKAKDLVKEFLT